MTHQKNKAGEVSSPKAVERKKYTVKVTTHSHKGKSCAKGDQIELTARQAERLQKKKVI